MTDRENALIPPAWGHHAPSQWVTGCLRRLHALPATPPCRRLALWLSKPFRQWMRGWVDVEVWGLRLRLRSRGNLSEQRMIVMPQFLDRVERMTLADRLSPGSTFLDIGANAGAYSLWAASRNIPALTVHAFEPDPGLCGSLEFNIRTNHIESIRLHRLAVGARTGPMKLVAGAGNLGENRVEAAMEGEDGLVEMTTLPDFLDAHGIQRIDALKIDIEGHECDALEPLFREVDPARWPRLLICELVHDAESRLARLLVGAGYEMIAKGRLNGIYQKLP